MALPGFLALFQANPQQEVGPDGRMPLADHFREFRARLLRSLLVVAVLFGVWIFFFDTLYDLVYGPYQTAVERLPEGSTIATTSGPGGGLMVYLKLSGFAAVVCAAPYWLYQLWAFVLPGLHPAEKKWSRIFVAIAGPLFLAGVALGYVTLPKALEVLIGFNPEGLVNLNEFNDFLTFFSRTLLVFGIAFEIPVFVVLLNLVGVLKGATLGKYRPWVIVGTFIFAAVATPSADPFTMTIMAVPMVLLFFISEAIARVNDRRRARRAASVAADPDEATVL